MILPPIYTSEVPDWVQVALRERLDNWDARPSPASTRQKILAGVAEYMAQERYGLNPVLDVRVDGILYLWKDGIPSRSDEKATRRPDFTYNGIPHDVKNAKSVNQDELLAYPAGTRIVRVWQLHKAEGNWWNARIGWLPVEDILEAEGMTWHDDKAGRGNKFAYINDLEWLTPEL